MTDTRRFAGNFVIQVMGKILSVLVGLVSIAVLTRALGQFGFGEYTTAITFLQVFGVIVDFGLSLTLIVMISEPGADEKKIVGNIFTLRMVSAAILFGIAPIIVLAFPWSHTVKLGVLVGAAAYFLMSGAAMLVGLFQKHATIWRASLAELINRIVLLGIVILFSFHKLGVVPMISALVAANAVWLFLMIWFAKTHVRIRPQFDLSIWKDTVRRSWPIAVSILFNLVYLKGDLFFLSLLRTPEEVGLYGVSYRIIDVLTVIPTIFMGLLLPSLVADWAKKGKGEFEKHIHRAFSVFVIMVIPIIAGAQVIGNDLMVFIAGQEFADSGIILRILIWALIGVFFGALYGHTVVAINKQKLMLFGYAATAVLSVAGYLWSIPRFGMIGAAGVTIFSESLIAILTFSVIWHEIRVRPPFLIFWKATVAAIVMAYMIKMLPETHVLLTMTAGAIIYTIVLLILGGISRQTIRELMPSRLAIHK